ncbi:4'-phosphopantetheinyl transferase family protein [Staphylococcus marylandisciuri]|uniref:4'-phosphopantetheinyl transferase family protein n=1 Tax=Staphylococcus marylandisciuri TaxID=2981529 RepID=UPI003570B3BC
MFNIVSDKDKIIKYKDSDPKYNTLISKLLLHYYFQKNYNVSNFKIQRTRYNKPYIKNSNIHFNISYSKDLIVLSVNNSGVGIDIENIEVFNHDIIKNSFQ